MVFKTMYLDFNFLGGTWRLIPYFCGNEEFCLTPSKRSLDAAINNVINNYLLVGVLDDYRRFLQLGETLLTPFFRFIIFLYRISRYFWDNFCFIIKQMKLKMAKIKNRGLVPGKNRGPGQPLPISCTERKLT